MTERALVVMAVSNVFLSRSSVACSELVAVNELVKIVRACAACALVRSRSIVSRVTWFCAAVAGSSDPAAARGPGRCAINVAATAPRVTILMSAVMFVFTLSMSSWAWVAPDLILEEKTWIES